MRALLLSLTLILAVGCQCSETDGEPGPNGERRTIAVIPKGTTHEFWKAVHAGAEKAARELSVEVLWKGPQKEDDRTAQVQVVEDFVTRGVDAIVLMPLDKTALVRPAQEAAAAGIPVVVADSDLDWDGRVSFVATDNYAGGRMAGERLAELLGGSGKVVLMRYLEGSASTMKREQGFLDAIAEHAGIEVISENQRAGATVDGAQKTAENLLNKFPAIDGIFCPNESSAYGMMKALVDAGRAQDVQFVGFDSSEKLLAGLQAGQIDALVLQDPVRMGYLAVKAAVDHLDGRAVEARIDTGVGIATADNVDDPRTAELLSPDLSILGE